MILKTILKINFVNACLEMEQLMDRLLIIHNAYDAREFYEDNKNGYLIKNG